jgi:hypothetical protein
LNCGRIPLRQRGPRLGSNAIPNRRKGPTLTLRTSCRASAIHQPLGERGWRGQAPGKREPIIGWRNRNRPWRAEEIASPSAG